MDQHANVGGAVGQLLQVALGVALYIFLVRRGWPRVRAIVAIWALSFVVGFCTAFYAGLAQPGPMGPPPYAGLAKHYSRNLLRFARSAITSGPVHEGPPDQLGHTLPVLVGEEIPMEDPDCAPPRPTDESSFWELLGPFTFGVWPHIVLGAVCTWIIIVTIARNTHRPHRLGVAQALQSISHEDLEHTEFVPGDLDPNDDRNWRAQEGSTAVVGRGRAATLGPWWRYAAKCAKAKFVTVEADTPAQRQAVRRFIYDLAVARRVRKSHIAEALDLAVEVCFLPSMTEVEARAWRASSQAEAAREQLRTAQYAGPRWLWFGAPPPPGGV
jgi:hypothetical protein